MSLKNLLRRLGKLCPAVFLTLSTALTSANAAEAVLDANNPNVRAVIAVQQDVTADLMQNPAIIGTAVGLDQAGNADLVIYVNKEAGNVDDVVRSLPPQLRGVAIRAELTDRFVAYKRPTKPGGGGGTTVSHTAPQAAPIQLGTSGGWRNDLANGYCCGGTLGSLIQVNGVQYILSNYHVLEADIVSGGNGLTANTGDAVIQPGLIDVSCNANNSGVIGQLVKIGSLPNANVDCAVAQALTGMVRTDGSILEIGTLSSAPVSAYLKQAVKKSGRTTGLTRSYVNGLNATISVTYENECAGGTAFTKTFTGQIVLANSGSSFLNSGDSGSLMVEDAATNPHPVGLLFAGSSTSAIANPIGEVLQYVGSKLGGAAAVVGN